jgi:UDP-N-acetylmuramyl pentapeptide phosphotransferase/UDP-N-acetylglucosamine-1-phosphate transferase
MLALDSFKVLLPAIVSFVIGIAIAPSIGRFLHTYKLWKKKNVAKTIDGKEATITAKLHNDEKEPVPRMGGIVVWFSVFVTTFIFWLISRVYPTVFTVKLEFISRNQTWLPLFAMAVGAVVGGLDDLLVVEAFKGKLNSYIGGGLSFPVRLLAVSSLGLFAGWWFYAKLGIDYVYVPFHGDVHLGGLLFILFFVIVTLATFSTGVIDGVDGPCRSSLLDDLVEFRLLGENILEESGDERVVVQPGSKLGHVAHEYLFDAGEVVASEVPFEKGLQDDTA